MYKRILVPVDGSDAMQCGIAEAVKLAREQQADVRLLHVVNELVLTGPYDSLQNVGAVLESLREGGKHTLDEATRYARSLGATVEPVLLEAIGGRAAERIVEYAREWPADLIVIGTHGRRGLQRLALGSDAELVARHAPVPVLLVRAPGHR